MKLKKQHAVDKSYQYVCKRFCATNHFVKNKRTHILKTKLMNIIFICDSKNIFSIKTSHVISTLFIAFSSAIQSHTNYHIIITVCIC